MNGQPGSSPGHWHPAADRNQAQKARAPGGAFNGTQWLDFIVMAPAGTAPSSLSDTADGDAEIEPQLELNQTRLGLEACLRSLRPAKRAAKGSGVA